MACVAQFFEWLAQAPAPIADRILSAGFEFAEPAYASRFVDLLQQRDHPASRAALLGAFPMLPAAQQHDLVADTERCREAIALGLRLPSTWSRCNVLRVLADHPSPQLAIYLSDALRGRPREESELAARVLSLLIENALTRLPAEEITPPLSFELRQLCTAVQEVVVGFERHWRLDPVRIGLTLARHFDERFWQVMARQRSPLRQVVSERLETWDEPRLAGFLICAMSRDEWRPVVEPVVRRWSGVEQICALFRESALLDDPTIAAGVAAIRRPAWFENVDQFIMQMPAALRAQLPRWVSAASLREPDRFNLLTRWMTCPCPQLRRGCVYVMSRSKNRDAVARMEEASLGTDASATFARWWIEGRKLEGDRRTAAEPVGRAEFHLLWRSLRTLDSKTAAPLIALFRENAELWRAEINDLMVSGEARDRLLVLQALATRELAFAFHEELKTLLNDPLERIRNLTRVLQQSVARAKANGETVLPRSTATIDEQRAAVRASVGAAVLQFLASVFERQRALGVDVRAVRALHGIIREYRGAAAPAASVGVR